jgi:tetrahydromethanopterin S-methyltransferase subunit H
MHRFSTEQKCYRIGEVDIGGQPGERPPVLIGSLFYARHRIVTDTLRGTFDEDEALRLLDTEADAAQFTGIPRFVDPVGDTVEALVRYITFIGAHTGAPILVDSPSQAARIGAIRQLAGSDLSPRLVYNSIAEDFTDEELAAIRECGVKSAIVLAFSTGALRPKQRLALLQDKLLPAAESAGVEHILVDTGVLDMPSVAWAALAIREVKEHLGYPAGCAPANAICNWKAMTARSGAAHIAAASSALALVVREGADFLLYGPMRFAPWAYPAVAAASGLVAYGGRFAGTRPATEDHPLYKVF